jgi:hypothetical protein
MIAFLAVKLVEGHKSIVAWVAKPCDFVIITVLAIP